MGALFFGRVYSSLQISNIIKGVKNPQDVDTVFHRLADKHIHHVIGIMLIPQQVLSSQKHLQLCFFEFPPQQAQPLPRIFVQIPHTDIKGRSAPTFDGIVSHFIQHLRNRQHVRRLHPGSHQRLMGVPQYGFCKFNSIFFTKKHFSVPLLMILRSSLYIV